MGFRFSGRRQDGEEELREVFFGIGPSDKEQLILEPCFLLMYYGGFTASEVGKLPVWQKRWFIDRIIKELNNSKGAGNPDDPQPLPSAAFQASRALHHNSPEARELQSKTRSQAPSRLRRFT